MIQHRTHICKKGNKPYFLYWVFTGLNGHATSPVRLKVLSLKRECALVFPFMPFIIILSSTKTQRSFSPIAFPRPRKGCDTQWFTFPSVMVPEIALGCVLHRRRSSWLCVMSSVSSKPHALPKLRSVKNSEDYEDLRCDKSQPLGMFSCPLTCSRFIRFSWLRRHDV